jgi:hypothetical protein
MPILFFSLLAAILILCDLHYMGLLPGYQGPGGRGIYGRGPRRGECRKFPQKQKAFYQVTRFQKSQKYKKAQNIFTLKYIQ